MKTSSERGRAKYRMTVKLDLEWDADLIGWLEGLAQGNRSALIRETLRTGLRQPARWEPVDIDEMRSMVAEELSKVLSGQQPTSTATASPADGSQVDVEAKYGAKLDKLLGGFTAGSQGTEEGG